jgi:hypothetical protein
MAASTASKPKGTISVYFDERYQKYHARIYRRGQFFHVGRFATKKVAAEEAAKALDKMPVLPPIVRVPAPLDSASQEVAGFIEELSASGVV